MNELAGELADSDRELLDALRRHLLDTPRRDRPDERRQRLDRIVVSFDQQPSRAVALYVTEDFDLVRVDEVASGPDQTFEPFDLASDETPALIRDLSDRFGRPLAFRICPIDGRPLGFRGCPH